MAPVLGGKNSKGLKDGVYEAKYSSFPNSATVRVTITDSRIVQVELVRHVASSRGQTAAEVIPQRIIEQQSTDVDALSGATNSSRVIMNAAEQAVAMATEPEASSNAAD